MKQENRLFTPFTFNYLDGSLNFIPKMNREILTDGYKQVLASIYSPKQYYERIETFLGEYKPKRKTAGILQVYHIRAFFRSMCFLGVWEKGRRCYWKLFFSTLFRSPEKFPLSIEVSASTAIISVGLLKPTLKNSSLANSLASDHPLIDHLQRLDEAN